MGMRRVEWERGEWNGNEESGMGTGRVEWEWEWEEWNGNEENGIMVVIGRINVVT